MRFNNQRHQGVDGIPAFGNPEARARGTILFLGLTEEIAGRSTQFSPATLELIRRYCIGRLRLLPIKGVGESA
jgi:hypothetical protein